MGTEEGEVFQAEESSSEEKPNDMEELEKIVNDKRTQGNTWHLNTPRHPKGRESIERLHSTLSDHLREYQGELGLEIDIAMRKAVAAYDHSNHSITGFSPVEVLFVGNMTGLDGDCIR